MLKNKKIKIAISIISLVALLLEIIGIVGGLGGVSVKDETKLPVSSAKCQHESFKNGLCTKCLYKCPHVEYKNGACVMCNRVCIHESHSTTLNESGGYRALCSTCDLVLRHEIKEIVELGVTEAGKPFHDIDGLCVGNGIEGGSGCGKRYDIERTLCTPTVDKPCRCGRTATEYCDIMGHNFSNGICKMCGITE